MLTNPNQVNRRRKIAETLMMQGSDTSPVQHPFQALARVAQGGIGGYGQYQADQQEAEGMAGANAEMARLLQGNPDNAAIMQAMSNPWATEGTGRIAGALLERNFRASEPKDPIKMGKGDVLLDPETYEPLYQPGAGGAMPVDIDEVVKLTKQMESSPGVSRFREVQPTVASMHKSLDDPASIADLDFIYGVAKILDPTSVVREGEMGLVVQSQSLGDTLTGQLNKLLNGEQALTPRVRKQLYRLARRRAEELEKQAQGEATYFQQQGGRYGMTPDYFRPLDALPEFDMNAPDPVMQSPTSQFDLMTQPQGGGGGWQMTPRGNRIRQVQ